MCRANDGPTKYRLCFLERERALVRQDRQFFVVDRETFVGLIRDVPDILGEILSFLEPREDLGREVCFVPLTSQDDLRVLSMETEAREYGYPYLSDAPPSARLAGAFRVIRAERGKIQADQWQRERIKHGKK